MSKKLMSRDGEVESHVLHMWPRLGLASEMRLVTWRDAGHAVHRAMGVLETTA